MSGDDDIWRPFYLRTWSDRRVTALSRPTPNAQTLLMWLFVGKQTGQIPGLFEIGERAFAEMLGWPLHGGETLLEPLPERLPKGFREAFREVSEQGWVKADWNARLVYVPSAIRKPKPANPNVVRGWRKAWRSLPECDLKDEAARDFKLFLEGLGEGFAKAFDEVLGNGTRNQDPGSRKQEAGGGKRANPRAGTPLPPIETTMDAQALDVTAAEAAELFEHYQDEQHRRRHVQKVLMPPTTSIDLAKPVLVLAGRDMAMAKAVVTAFIESDHPYWLDRRHALWMLGNVRDFEQARASARVPKAKAPKRDAAADMRALTEEARAIARERQEREAANGTA
jgi:hypothetical protein